MARKKILELKPSRQANSDLKKLAERAREINDRFVAEGRRFSDSAETIRSDRDSR
jgi:hypothetical protein